MRFELQVLGANSAIPTKDRFPTSLALFHRNEGFLFDCGEGTQIQVAKYRVKIHKVSHIFISHLHGDHIFGLPGLITTMQLQNREQPLTIHGPVGIKAFIINAIKLSGAYLGYPIFFNELEAMQNQLVLDHNSITVTATALDHRIDTLGYRIDEKPHPINIDSEAIQEYNLTIEEILKAKAGKDIHRPDGTVILSTSVTMRKNPERSFGFCTDTRYKPDLAEFYREVDLLYHEATYLDELKYLAIKTLHSTALEAATFAQYAGAKQLVIGHYSSRYDDLTPLLNEAQSIFQNTALAIEGVKFDI